MSQNFAFSHTKHNGDFPANTGHYHNMYEIYFLKTGSCRYFIGDRLFHIAEGDIVLISKGIIHKSLYPDAPVERYLINFTDDMIPDEISGDMKKLFQQSIYHTPKESAGDILTIFKKIERETNSPDKYSPLVTTGLLTELLTYILRHPSDKAEMVSNLPIENVPSYIAGHYREQLTLENMAEMCSLSTSYFSRLFKNITGFGFKEYLTMLRLKEAQSLLMHTDLSICKVAYECGFNDSNYFSVVFKELIGLSPLKYRKQNRIKDKKHG